MRALLICLVLCLAPLAPSPAFAVQPDEVLSDPALESRAREISKGLRCLVCRNENIDDSNATLARDLRLLVRERLVAGDSNDETVAFIVDRYGEYVLLSPKATGANWVLWGAGPLMLLLALIIGFFYLRRREQAVEPVETTALSDEEKERLARILDN